MFLLHARSTNAEIFAVSKRSRRVIATSLPHPRLNQSLLDILVRNYILIYEALLIVFLYDDRKKASRFLNCTDYKTKKTVVNQMKEQQQSKQNKNANIKTIRRQNIQKSNNDANNEVEAESLPLSPLKYFRHPWCSLHFYASYSRANSSSTVPSSNSNSIWRERKNIAFEN